MSWGGLANRFSGPVTGCSQFLALACTRRHYRNKLQYRSQPGMIAEAPFGHRELGSDDCRGIHNYGSGKAPGSKPVSHPHSKRCGSRAVPE